MIDLTIRTYNLADNLDFEPMELDEHVASAAANGAVDGVVGASLICINKMPYGGCEVTVRTTDDHLCTLHTEQCISAVMRNKSEVDLETALVNFVIFGGDILTDRFGLEYTCYNGLAVVYDPAVEISDGEELFCLTCAGCGADGINPMDALEDAFDDIMSAGLGSVH